MRDGTDSVGVVCHAEYLKTRKKPIDQFLADTFAACPQMKRRMSGAKIISDVHVAGNYSYKSDTMYGDRYLLVGDAYAFLDPMFSTGVLLAMESAMRGATAVDRYLEQQQDGLEALANHAETMDRGLEQIAWFIYKFNSRATQELFMTTLNPFNVRRSITLLLSGDAFGKRGYGFGISLFKIAHHALSFIIPWADRVTRHRGR